MIRDKINTIEHNIVKLLRSYSKYRSFGSLHFQSTPRYSRTIEFLLSGMYKSYTRNQYTCAGMYRSTRVLYTSVG